jgi:hypothetical protein
MPRRLIPATIWEDEFYVPLPGEPRRIGPLADLFQGLLNRTEYTSNYIASVLGLPWGATPPDTLAGLAARVSTLEAGAVSETPYDIAIFYSGAPHAGAVLAAVVAPRTFSLLGGSVRVQTAPSANWTGSIFLDGLPVGTVDVPANALYGTVSLYNTPTAVFAGTTIRIVGPSTADPTIRDISISLQGVT